MRRGKDEEKIMGPMFSRIHVNDTEKGGPKAPPRNKMALYEQLSIPSQRFNHGVLPSASSIQGDRNERATFFPHQSSGRHRAGKLHSQYSDLSSQLTQLEWKKSSDEDDFTVPIFIHSRPTQGPRKYYTNQTSMSVHSTQQENQRQKDESLKELVACPDSSVQAMSNESLTDKTRDELKKHFSSDEKMIINDAETREDRGDSVSETSMVDSVSSYDVTPDDVVSVIGQKHFWRARRAILNQQKVFAVQVFELHRLVKVQRSIAASPHLLVEEAAYLGNPVKDSAAKKFPLDYNVNVPLSVPKRKRDLNKPSRPTECSAESTVEKASVSSLQYSASSGNHPSPPANGANSLVPLCFNQPNGHHWLIPVMTPSEGLVYKPYTARDLTGPTDGGYGPHGSTPVYGFPVPHYQYQLPFFHAAAPHGYFPPYGMPLTNPSFSRSSDEHWNSITPHGNLPSVGVGPDPPHQQTESNPSESGTGNSMEGDNMLRLFPTSPSADIPDPSPRPSEDERSAHVIKVVPHNAVYATESAARIFKSIQEERKQYDL